MDEEKLLKGEEVAIKLNISRSFAYQLMANGAIRTVRIGTAVRVRPQDLEQYIANRSSGDGMDNDTGNHKNMS